MQEEKMHLPQLRDRLEDAELTRGQAGETEEREPGRKLENLPIGRKPRGGDVKTLRRAWHADPLPQAAPQLALPTDVGAFTKSTGGPSENHVGTVHGVLVK